LRGGQAEKKENAVSRRAVQIRCKPREPPVNKKIICMTFEVRRYDYPVSARIASWKTGLGPIYPGPPGGSRKCSRINADFDHLLIGGLISNLGPYRAPSFWSCFDGLHFLAVDGDGHCDLRESIELSS